MRAQQEAALPDRCDILRASYGVNPIGEATATWGTVASSVACRLSRLSAKKPQIETGDQVEYVYDAQVTFAWNQDVREGDRLVFGADRYEVVRLFRAGDWRTAQRVGVRLIE